MSVGVLLLTHSGVGPGLLGAARGVMGPLPLRTAAIEAGFGEGYEEWDGFAEYHQIGFDECENFDYEAYRANGFEVVDPREAVLGPEPQGLAY